MSYPERREVGSGRANGRSRAEFLIDDSDIVFRASPVCSYCLHWDTGRQSCSAFGKIPDLIWMGEDYHVMPFPGDNGIQFEFRPEVTESVKKDWQIRRIRAEGGKSRD